MIKIFLNAILLMLFTASAMAQQQSDHFLAEVFGINNFKINSTLQDVQKDRQVAENLSFFRKIDNMAVYDLKVQQINLPGLHQLDRLAFDTLELTFENNKLHGADLYMPAPFRDEVFKKAWDQFNSKYGQALIVDQKKSKYKKYVWNLGSNELTLRPDAEGLLIHYASKISDKKTGWIYSDRKGKGDGKIQFNLPYFQKLLQEKLTISSFEKNLPDWETKGVSNHVFYMLNFQTMADNSPSFSITYSLKNYDIRITTEDTTSKVISEFALEKIKDTKVWSQFEKDINNLHYTLKPKLKYSHNITYSNHTFLVYLDKGDSIISVMNDFKFKLP